MRPLAVFAFNSGLLLARPLEFALKCGAPGRGIEAPARFWLVSPSRPSTLLDAAMGDAFTSDAKRAVFISYAREDTAPAQRIADALRSHGVEVWFDQSELRGGDVWDQKIRHHIRECTLLVPIISAHTQERSEGYFRLEWRLAIERTHLMMDGVPFLVPVVVDETRESEAAVPPEFLKVQWTRLPGALPTPQFVAQIKRLLEVPRRPGAAKKSDFAAPPPPPVPPAGKPRLLGALVTALAATVIGLVAYIALQSKSPSHSELPAPNSERAASAAPAPPASASAPASRVGNKSIAVLPLANLSDDKDTGFFADGVHEDLLTNLALVAELRVVSRTSALQYRGTQKPMRQIGEELGVAYVLEGSVRRAGNTVRVTAQLIYTPTDEHVWARNYDRELTDIFAIQAELAGEIATALSAAISPETQKLLARRPTENPAAYDAFLKGRALLSRSPAASRTAYQEIEAHYKTAVQLDPQFAAAWGELAVIHALHAFFWLDAAAERLAQADAAIARAVRLAPDAPDVVRTIGTYAYYAHRDYARANAQYEKLARLQPNNPMVYSSLGLIQRRQGRWAESLVNLRRAVELDPANVSYTRNLKASLERIRRWDEAIAVQQRVVALLPGDLREQFALADLNFKATGSLRAANELLARLSPSDRESPIAVYYRSRWAVTRGDFAEFRRLEQVQPFFQLEGWVDLAVVSGALVYFVLGETAAVHERLTAPLAEWRARLEREPANVQAMRNVGQMEALLGRPAEALRLAQQALALLPESRDAIEGANSRFNLAWVHAVTGDADRALEELTRCLRSPSGPTVATIRDDLAFKKLHGDPRFEALLNDPRNNQPLF